MKQPSSVNQLLQDFCATQRLKTRVDADGTSIIPGKLGHAYEYDDHLLAVMVMPFPSRKQYWAITRTKLVKLGFVILQNGDCEGSALFDPHNPEQAKAAIRAAGIKRRRQISPEQREKQIERLRAAAGGAL